MRNLTLAVLLAAMTLTLVACEKEYHSRSVPLSVEYDQLWSALRKVVGKKFEIDEKKSNKKDGVLVTRWKLDLSTEYLRTYRRQLDAQLVVHPDDEDKDEKDQRWQVKLNIIRELNENIEKPLEADVAEWSDPEFDEQLERILLAELNMEVRGPEIEDQPVGPRELDETADGKWVVTREQAVTQSEAWDSVLKIGRDKGFSDKVLQPQVGRYESDWLPKDHHQMEQANSRYRMVALVVPKTTEGKTRHEVQVRIELQGRDRLEDEWRDTGRDKALEQAWGAQVEDQMLDRVVRASQGK